MSPFPRQFARTAAALWLASLAFVSVATPLPPLPQLPGFARFDVGFGGVFEDLVLNRLALDQTERGFTGELSYLGDWKISAKANGDLLQGTARRGSEQRPFQARRDGEILEVTVGTDTLRLYRTVALDPALADLGPAKTDPARRWTIAIYLDGDNDLEGYAVQDLADMQRSLPANGVEVVVLFDRAKGYSTADGDWTDTRIFRLQPGAEKPELVRKVGEQNMGDAGTLGSFLTGVFATYPAEHYAAIVWDHGGGWTGIADDKDAPNYEGGTCMLDLRDVRVGLRTAYFHATHKRLDLLAFDACLMAQLEVALQVSDHADFLVASEASVPGEGFPYESVLPLFGDPKLTTRGIATRIVDAFGKSYEEMQNPNTTISALDLEHAAKVADALDRLAARCLPATDKNWPAFSRALYYGESYEARSQRTKEGKTPSLDLADLLDRLERGVQPFPAPAELTAVRAALGKMVLASHNGDERRLSRGLAVYAPRFEKQQSPGYAIAPLAQKNRWPDLIKRVHAKAAESAKAPVSFDELSVYATTRDGKAIVHPMDGDHLQFTLNGQGIVQVLQFDAMKDGDVYAVLRKTWVPDPAWMTRAKAGASDLGDLFMPQFNDGKTALTSELVGLRFMVANEATSTNLTINSVSTQIDAPYTARAKLRRSDSTEPVNVEVYFDRAWWRAESIFEISADPKIEPRQISPRPDDDFSFIIDTFDEAGARGEIETAPLRWGKGLMLVPVADEPGEYRSYLAAITMDGRETDAAIDYLVEENASLREWTDSWKAWKPEMMRDVWSRQLATGPNEWQDLNSNARFGEPLPGHPGVLKVFADFELNGKRETVTQTWIIDTRGVPTLRIIQELEGHRTLCWYGPARFSGNPDEHWIAMKVLQVGGVIWRWKYSVFESLKLPE